MIAVDPTEHARIGSMQYAESLPLADKEVVLTFDDGPLPPHTGRVLEVLASECVKATFFMVGRMARAYPDWVRRVYNAGHTVATHSHSHPHSFRRLTHEKAVAEIEDGIGAVGAALGDPRALAPFFRFPGLGNSKGMESYLAERGLMTWSADFPADDWMRISAEKVKERALSRLEQKGRGILLLHDIQPVTVLALPELLRELKARGYRIVHVVPAGPDRPKTVTEPQAWVFHRARVPVWPVVLPKNLNEPPALSAPSALSFGFPNPLAESFEIASFDGRGPAMTVSQAGLTHRSGKRAPAVWPPVPGATAAATAVADALPAPSLADLNLPSVFGGRHFLLEPAAAEHRAAVEAPRPAQAAAPQRPPRAARVRAASAREDNVSPRAGDLVAWPRLLNWGYTQP